MNTYRVTSYERVIETYRQDIQADSAEEAIEYAYNVGQREQGESEHEETIESTAEIVKY